ncbi:hypothetical protein BaRGS_00030305, partial [Batillaria attramentaria]
MLLPIVTMVIVLVAVPTRVSGSPSNGRPAISATCASQTDQLRAATTKKEEWAMKILDAYGKPGPGILQQRLHWLGSYDECRAVRSPSVSTPSGNHTSPWGGQYCLASLSLYPVNGVPGLSEAAVILALIGVEDVQCRPREIKLSTGAQIVLALLALLAIVVGGATVYDVYVVGRTNFIRFKDTGRGQGQGQVSREELTCLHGIRVLSILWIMLGHTHFYATQVPTANVAFLWRKYRHDAWYQLVFNSGLGADTFFVIRTGESPWFIELSPILPSSVMATDPRVYAVASHSSNSVPTLWRRPPMARGRCGRVVPHNMVDEHAVHQQLCPHGQT